MMTRKALTAMAAISLFTGPTAAQDMVDAGMIGLQGWDYEDLYASGSWSIDTLFGADVTGSTGDRIGDVEDIVLNDGGEVVALIAAVGGFWDIGDTHVSVPWDVVEIAEDGSVAVPITEENLDEFDLFASTDLPEGARVSDEIVEGVDNRDLGAEVWRASELIGDYVRVRGDADSWVNFGYVSDILVDDGLVSATLVSATSRHGAGNYAYPYRGGAAEGYGIWHPEAASQDLPVLIGDASTMPPFDMNLLQSDQNAAP